MAPKWVELGAVLLVLANLSAGTMAQSGCSNVLISMASCLNYVTGSVDTPPPTCCTALANVVQTQPECLCVIVNSGGGSLGVNLNQTRALGLPSVCTINTPPASRCNDLSPAGSPISPDSPSGTGSKTNTPSNGSTTTINLQLIATFLLIIASYTSNISNYF